MSEGRLLEPLVERGSQYTYNDRGWRYRYRDQVCYTFTTVTSKILLLEIVYMKRKCQIGDRYVGGDNPCFITFEAGPTHNGIDSAKNLVKAASDAGADAVKFQILDVDRLVSDRTQLFTYKYLDQTSGKLKEKSEPLYDILARRCLKKQEWAQIRA